MKRFVLGLFAILVVLGCVLFSMPSKAKPPIYDTFLFFNELELLKIRLHELEKSVDKFVLVECAETFTGNPKELIFAHHKEEFSDFKDKIIHVIVAEHFETPHAYKREEYQRNQVLRGLEGCSDDTVVLLSDIDEVPRIEVLPKVSRRVQKDPKLILAFKQTFYRFYLNRFWKKKWRGTTATSYATMKELTPEGVRRKGGKMPAVRNAGWHFSNLGGLDRYIEKIEAFSHTESNVPEQKELSNFKKMITTCKKVKVGRSFPHYVQEHQEELREMGLIE